MKPVKQKKNDLQKMYVKEYFLEPHNQIEHRQVRSFAQSYLKNANIWISLLAIVVCGYFLDRELDWVYKLLQIVLIVYLYLINLFSEMIKSESILFWPVITRDFWCTSNLISVGVFLLVALFVAVNIGEDIVASFKIKQEQKRQEDERLRMSSCKRIKPHKYQKETAEYTKKEVTKLLNSEAYHQHMINRNGESQNW